jgi:hypothetical protein
MKSMSRRNFSKLMTSAAATTAAAPLGLLNARIARAQSCDTASFSVWGFGPIVETVPLNTYALNNVEDFGDLTGVPIVALPADFQYTVVSIVGQPMSDGNIVTGNHDGMACFQGRRGNYVLVRNHERSISNSPGGCTTANGKQYDPFQGPGFGHGGTSTVVVDRNGLVVEDYVSLGGTIRNCAGGPTPWRSWISCEENVTTPTSDPRATKKHGYNFEVPSGLGEGVDAIPLVAMGRMNHEAVSVDPQDGCVYETEDRGDSAYYKFTPRRRPKRFGDLQEGGDLFAMVIKPNQRSVCDGVLLPTTSVQGAEVVDTRGLDGGADASILSFLGQRLEVEWVKLDDVDPDQDTLRFEAQSKGAALWFRGEGAWYHRGKHYWVCSNAGDAGEGQVWCYDPTRKTVTLIVESTDENLLDGPDNMTIARDGTIYLCEDGSGGSPGNPNYGQRIVGVDASGGLFDFAHNRISTDEFAGACFSPNGHYMYVNVQGAGMTLAIWRTDGRPIYAKAGFVS